MFVWDNVELDTLATGVSGGAGGKEWASVGAQKNSLSDPFLVPVPLELESLTSTSIESCY